MSDRHQTGSSHSAFVEEVKEMVEEMMILNALTGVLILSGLSKMGLLWTCSALDYILIDME